jgi:hypothetical protein
MSTSKLFAILTLSMGAVSSVYADATANLSVTCFPLLQWLGLCTPGHTGPTPAPEIDPASAVSALALLAGGIAVLRGRKSEKK